MIEATLKLYGTSLETPSIEYPGVHFKIAIDGRRVSGGIQLDQANPIRRNYCHVAYTRPVCWPDDQHAAALRVAGHWLRDIGGIGILAKRHLCHIVSRLNAGHEEQPMHWAVDAYAQAEWHRKNKLWSRP